MSEKNQTYELCGLKKNPLASTFKKELCPLTSEDCDFLYAKVEGFGKHVSIIKQWFAKADNLDRSNSILIFGANGSGQSSVANYIARQFYLAKGIEKKIPLIKSVVEDHHDLKPVRDLLVALYHHLNQVLGRIFEQEYRDIKDLYSEIRLRELQRDVCLYQSLFLESLPILDSSQCTPIIVIADKIKTYKQIHSIQKVFNRLPLIIYTTDKQEVNDAFKEEEFRKKMHGFVVELEKLSLKDIQGFLSHRWSKCSNKNQPHPFDEKVLSEIFGERQFYFNLVVNILTEIFKEHSKTESGSLDISDLKIIGGLSRIIQILANN